MLTSLRSFSVGDYNPKWQKFHPGGTHHHLKPSTAAFQTVADLPSSLQGLAPNDLQHTIGEAPCLANAIHG
jgi:hypothetical protein